MTHDLEIMYQAFPQYVKFTSSWLDLLDALDDFVDSVPPQLAWLIP